jgi:hypothetical protein
VVCSGRSSKLVADFASQLDFVGGRQRLRYWLGSSPPVLVEEDMPGGNGGLSLRDVRLSTLCAADHIHGPGKEGGGGEGRGQPPAGHAEESSAADAEAAAAALAAGRATGREQEDWHFAVCIARLGGRVGTLAQQEAFAAYGRTARPGAFGAHKLDLSSSGAQDFLATSCPEYEGLLT